MEFILSLAHFCEVHGPTSILATQAFEHACPNCPVASAVGSLSASISQSSSSSSAPSSLPSEFWTGPSGAPPRSSPHSGTPLSTPPTTPPVDAPTSLLMSPFSTKSRKAGEPADADDDQCVNCAMSSPPEATSNSEEDNATCPISPIKSSKSNPPDRLVFRTKGSVLIASRLKSQGTTVHNDQKKAAVDEQRSPVGAPHPIPVPNRQSRTRFTEAIPVNLSVDGHAHDLTYTTSHHPSSSNAYSLLRHSCLRTLSYETLPRRTSSGPVLFGDATTGFTIAFIFRVPDPTARGHRRTYALLALGSRDSQRVMSAMGHIVKTFAGIANWIVGLSEAALDVQARQQRDKERSGFKGLTPVSSFLSAKRVDPDGFPRSPGSDGVTRNSVRGKSLAQVVGRDSIFVEMHILFVRLLTDLGKDFGIAT